MDLPLIKFVHEKFLKVRHVTNQKIQVLVRWKNVDEYFDTWEPAETLHNILDVSKIIDTLKTLPVVAYRSANFNSDMSEGVYVIEKILFAKQDTSGKIYVYIKWENYSIDDSTWEPIDNIDNFSTILPDLSECFEKTSLYISKVSLTLPTTFQSRPSPDSFSHCNSNVTNIDPIAQTPLVIGSSVVRQQATAHPISSSHPSTIQISTNSLASYRETFPTQSLNNPCVSFSTLHPTNNAFPSLLKSQPNNDNRLKNNCNQNILGFPNTFLKQLDDVSLLKLLQAYEKIGKAMPLTLSGKYVQLVDDFKMMITTVCQTVSTQNGNKSTLFSTKPPINLIDLEKNNDTAIYVEKNRIKDSIQRSNVHGKPATGSLNMALGCKNFDTVDLRNCIKDCLSREGEGSAVFSKDSELNFRSLFFEIKESLLIQYQAQKKKSQLLFQSIKESRDIASSISNDNNLMFHNIFNRKDQLIGVQNRMNETQNLVAFYDCVKKTAQYLRPTSTSSFFSHHSTNSETAADQTVFLNKRNNCVIENEKHKHNFRGQGTVQVNLKKSIVSEELNTKMHSDDNEEKKKLQNESSYHPENSQRTKTKLRNKGDFQKRSCMSTKNKSIALHQSLPRTAPIALTEPSRPTHPTLFKSYEALHDVSKVSQYVTKTVPSNKNLTTYHSSPIYENKRRPYVVQNEINNISTPYGIGSVQKHTHQVYRNSSHPAKQTSQQTSHDGNFPKCYELHPVSTANVDKSICRLKTNAVSGSAELSKEVFLLHQPKGSQSVTHKTPQNVEFSDISEKKLPKRSRLKVGQTRLRKSISTLQQNLCTSVTESRSTTKQDVQNSNSRLNSSASTILEDLNCRASDSQKINTQIKTPWDICIPASVCLLQLQSESKKSLSTLSLKYLPGESNQSLRCFCLYSERLSKVSEQNIIKWLSRQSPSIIKNGISCTVCSSQDHFLCSLNWKSLTTKKTVDTKIELLLRNFVCIPCRLQLLDPFFCVKNICGLSIAQSPEDVVFSETLIIKKTPIDFHLSNSFLKQLEEGKLLLQFRGMELCPDTYRVSNFPSQLSLYISGALTKPSLLTLKPPGPLKKRKEIPHTLDAKDILENKIKRFIIECGFQKNKTFLFCLVLVSPITSETLLNLTLKNNWLSLSLCRDLANAVISHTIKKVNTNDDIVVERQDVNVVSLRCPSTLMRINLPGRGIFCRHLQCFDIHFYIESQSRIGSHKNRWKCPVCYGFCYVHEIILDSFFNDILNQTHELDRMVIIKSTNKELLWRVTERDQSSNVDDSIVSTSVLGEQSFKDPKALHHVRSECIEDHTPIEEPTLVIDID